MKPFLSTLLFLLIAAPTLAQDAWINEFHYDNSGSDVGEFLEIVIKDVGSFTLADFTVTHYNGSNGSTISSETGDNLTVGNTDGTFTIYTWSPSSLQNGNDALAVDYQGTVLDFVCYEGAFTATDGPANGQTCTDAGVSESSGTAIGESLQREGTGGTGTDFSWTGPIAETPGAINTNQTFTTATTPKVQFVGTSTTVAEDAGTTTLTIEITDPDGTEVMVDVAFVSATSSAEAPDIDGYTTQTVTFPNTAISGDTQTVTVTITDDSTLETDEDADFSLENVVTTGDAVIGSPSGYTVNITDNEVSPFSPGDLIISEFMADAFLGPDDEEYVEVLNNTDAPIDINGWILKDDGSNTHTIANGGPLLVPSHGVVLLAKIADVAGDGSVTPDYVYADYFLSNGADEIVLVNGTTEIARINYTDGDTFGDGVAYELINNAPGVDGVTEPGDYQAATDSFGINGDFGTPGALGNTTLPVELALFTAHLDGTEAVLRWATVSETNNAGFELQNQAPGQSDWHTQRFIEGAGTTTETQAYQQRLEGLLPGLHRFRLRQLDYDGTASYSPVVELSVGVVADYLLTPAYPNPFNPQTRFTLAVAQAQPVTVAVYDVLGRRVALLHEGLLAADQAQAFTFDAAHLPSGLYLLQATGARFQVTRTLTLLK